MSRSSDLESELLPVFDGVTEMAHDEHFGCTTEATQMLLEGSLGGFKLDGYEFKRALIERVSELISGMEQRDVDFIAEEATTFFREGFLAGLPED